MILSLSAPTDTARKAMEELGLEVFDAEGKLRPLNETFQDLNSKLGEMSDEDRINVLNTMFNKVDLKSVNALLANSGERFDELSGYIRDSAGAAEDMAETMNDNLKGKLTILGSALEGLGIEMYEEFQQPLKEAAETAIKSVDSISASLKSGKLSESMQTVARGIGTIVSKAAELAINALPKLIDGFAFLVDHAKLLGTVLASTAGAVATFKGAMLINDVVKSWNAAATAARMFGAGMTSSLTGAQAVVGGLTGNISKLGAITAALGGPMGVAALAAAGITAGIIALGSAASKAEKEVKRNKEAIKELGKELQNEQTAYEQRQETIEKNIESSMYEIDAAKELADSITDSTDSIVDANGKVKKGYEDRARALADEINNVIPNAIELTEEEGDMYLKTADKLDVLINKKKIEAILEAKREDYIQAIQNREEHTRKLIDAEKELKEAEEQQAEAYDLFLNQQMSQEAYNEFIEKTNEAKEAVEGWTDTIETDYGTIREYEELQTAALSENKEEQNAVMEKFNTDVKKYNAEQIEEANKQVKEKQEYYNKLKELASVEGSNISQTQVDEAKKAADAAKNVRDEAYQELLNQLPENARKVLESTLNSVQTVTNGATQELDKAKPEFQKSGENSGTGYAQGLESESTISRVTGAVKRLASTAIDNLNKSLDIHSPSRKAEKSGKNFDEGFAIGIEKNKGLAIESVEDLAESSLTTAMEQAEEYKDIGNLFGENYLAGLEEKLEATTELIEKNTDKSIKAYEEFIDEQTESAVQKINEQTDAEVEALQEQISKLKDVKDKGQKEANKAEIKEYEDQIKAIKENGKKRIQIIKDDAKEQKDAYKKGMQEIEKAGLDVIKKANSDIEKEYQSRKDSIVEKYQSQKDAILSLQDDLYSKVSEYGELFHYDDETGEMVLNDIEKINAEKDKFLDLIEDLKQAGFSSVSLKEILDLGVEEGIAYIEELKRKYGTGERLENYANSLDERRKVEEQRIQKIFEDDLKAVDTSFNQAMDKLANDMQKIIEEAFSRYINEFATVSPEKYAELIQLDPEFFNNMLNTLNAEILGNLSEQEGIVVPIKAEAEDFSEEVTKQVPSIQEAGSEATIALGEQIGKDGKEVVSEADDVGNDTVKALESHEPEFQQVGEEYMDRLIDGMQSKWGTAVSVAHEIAESLKEELEDVASFSMRDTEDAISARSLMESAEPAMISRLYESMVDSIGFYQSRLAAASTSYITNNESSRVENNMGDVNFNIAEVKGENADRSIKKMMEQAEFYRIQKRLAVGVK